MRHIAALYRGVSQLVFAKGRKLLVESPCSDAREKFVLLRPVERSGFCGRHSYIKLATKEGFGFVDCPCFSIRSERHEKYISLRLSMDISPDQQLARLDIDSGLWIFLSTSP